MRRAWRVSLLALCLILVVATVCFAHLVNHTIKSGTNWYNSNDTVQDSFAYYTAKLSEYIETVSSSQLHWIQNEVRSTITRGDPVWGMYYIYDSVSGDAYQTNYLLGKHMLDYSLIGFATDFDTGVATNKYPYSETYHYSKYLQQTYKLTSRYIP